MPCKEPLTSVLPVCSAIGTVAGTKFAALKCDCAMIKCVFSWFLLFFPLGRCHFIWI